MSTILTSPTSDEIRTTSISPSIRSDIDAGTTVVVDRYYYSGCVYSAAKNNPSLDLNWARQPEIGLPRPDVCLFLDISSEDAAKRGGFGEERYETKKIQDRVRELFNVLRKSPDKYDFATIDAGRSESEVERDVLDVVFRVCEDVDSGGQSLRTVEGW